MRRLIPILLFCSPLLSSCGDPTDRPEDCSPNEYFDQARKLCISCPAAVQPTCDDGCGFSIVADERGCPMTECMVQDCNSCAATEFVDAALQCVPCDGPTECPNRDPDSDEPGPAPERWVVDGACTLRCP